MWLFHSALAALGVAAALASSPVAFAALEVAGAAYLLYLAWGAWRAVPVTAIDASVTSSGVAARRFYSRGLIMNLTNPKVAIFFLAFLPAFAEAGTGSMAFRMLALGGWFIGVTLVVFGGVAWAAGFLGDWMRRSPKGQSVMNRLAAAVFIGLAVRLLVG